jgi:hypothetical protein
MVWRRRKPTVRHDALLLDAEFQIMLSELRYPSIYRLRASSPHPLPTSSEQQNANTFNTQRASSQPPRPPYWGSGGGFTAIG